MFLLFQYPEIYCTYEEDYSENESTDEQEEVSSDGDDAFSSEEGYEQAFYGDNDEDA